MVAVTDIAVEGLKAVAAVTGPKATADIELYRSSSCATAVGFAGELAPPETGSKEYAAARALLEGNAVERQWQVGDLSTLN